MGVGVEGGGGEDRSVCLVSTRSTLFKVDKGILLYRSSVYGDTMFMLE